MMRFFFRKKDEPKSAPPRRTDMITMTGRDFSDLDGEKAALKFWIPESIEVIMNELSSKYDTSASDCYRQMFFVHLYGRYDLTGLLERQDHRFALNSIPLYSIAAPATTADAEPTPMEKSIADVKVWVPLKMKEDLQLLARRKGVKLSQYVRSVVIEQTLGHIPYNEVFADPAIPPPESVDEDNDSD
jgi:hypothetical protein